MVTQRVPSGETDITVPVYSFTETHYVPVGLVTGGFKATLFFLTGKVNANVFKGFQAGEVLFLGASGSQRGKDDWEITYRFAASPNVTNLTVGSITGIAKRGWEYLWVRYADAEDQHVLVKQPIAAYVEVAIARAYWCRFGGEFPNVLFPVDKPEVECKVQFHELFRMFGGDHMRHDCDGSPIYDVFIDKMPY